MTPHYFHNLYIVISSVCGAVSLLHLMIYLRRREETVHLVFALMAFCSAGATVLDIHMHTATDVTEFVRALKATNTFQVLLWIAFAWFIQSYTRSNRRWPVFLVSGLYGLAGVLNISFSHGILFEHVNTLSRVVLPWGETIVFGLGPANAWRLLPDLAWFTVLAYALASSVGFYRQGQKQRAWFFGSSMFFCLGIGYLHGTLIDLGIFPPPSIWNATFLAMIILMSGALANTVVKVPELERRIATQLGKWQTLIDNAKMLIFGLDTRGRIDFVNPHFLRTTGYDQDEVIGRPLVNIVREEEKMEIGNRIQDAVESGVLPERSYRALVTKNGRVRDVHWSHVLLRDHKGAIYGTLSIGEDVTDRKELEVARDQAMQELQTLKNQLEAENLQLKEELLLNRDFEEIVGHSNAILYVLERVKQVAQTDATVLIQGETGVGKELIAGAIHRASSRSAKPYVRVNCAALTPNLIESELFGHEAGAYTGADRRRIGRFEMADAGTLLLDEISEIPMELQAKLLRVLQEGQFERVGGSHTQTVDVRMIATTNRILQDEVEKGNFRADLFYRLKVYPITVPPLRKRRDDIEMLVWHFLEKINARMGKTIHKIPQSVMQALTGLDYPGNVRELINLLEHAVITSENDTLILPAHGIEHTDADKSRPPSGLLISLDDAQRRHISHVLNYTDDRIEGAAGAAEILQLKPSTLRHRIKKLGIRRKK